MLSLLAVAFVFNYADSQCSSNSGDCNIRCDGNPYCVGTTIHCPSGRDCKVNCEYNSDRRRNLLGMYSCSGDNYGCCDSTIYCATDRYCEVDCSEGCSHLTIHAETASSLYIKDCNAENNGGKNNCYGMEIHCPQNGREGVTNMCEIQGDSSSYELQSSNIYAQEGFNDLTIHTMRLYDTTIYCGKTASEYYCESNIYGTGCASGEPTICNYFIVPTSEPTPQPTHITNAPTLRPTQQTNMPTIYPSNYPSNSPSKYPTHYPSTTPTTGPSTDPTYDPTIKPTESPTKYPTNYPTTDPTKDPTTPNLVLPHVDKETTDSPDNVVVQTNEGETDIIDDDLNEIPLDSNQLPSWVYVISGCAVILCCLTILLLVRFRKKKSVSFEDKGQNNRIKMSMDVNVWANPVHRQVETNNQITEGDNIKTNNTKHIKYSINSTFSQDTVMTTPMGIELSNIQNYIGSQGEEQDNIMIKDDSDDGIDEINNNINEKCFDEQIINDMNIIGATAGDDDYNCIDREEGGNTYNDMNHHKLTAGSYNIADDEFIINGDNENDNIYIKDEDSNDEMVGDIDNMLVTVGGNNEYDEVEENDIDCMDTIQ